MHVHVHACACMHACEFMCACVHVCVCVPHAPLCFLLQTSLQSVVGTAAAASFTDELSKWQKQLQTIEAVLEVWLRVQTLWQELEVRGYVCTSISAYRNFERED